MRLPFFKLIQYKCKLNSGAQEPCHCLENNTDSCPSGYDGYFRRIQQDLSRAGSSLNAMFNCYLLPSVIDGHFLPGRREDISLLEGTN